MGSQDLEHRSAHDKERHDKERPETAADEERPGTALGEVLHEAEEAETRVVDDGERRGSDGEAADALTPNANSQEDTQQHDA
ncbi:hypothetical protein [Streptomyces sp. NPDC059861]|uniref:hypothetical protein n=1 Tax=Streptomyces sp. NPDC059861 TaxID=3346974 RepID=UPI003667A1DE